MTMPVVHIEMMEGRSKDQKQTLIKEVTEVVSRNTGAPEENIHIIIRDIPSGNFASGGIIK